MSTKCDGGSFSTIKRVWDWETESKIWEVKEDMDRWATGVKDWEASIIPSSNQNFFS